MAIDQLNDIQKLRLQHEVYNQPTPKTSNVSADVKTSFEDALQKEWTKTNLQFSKHATKRVEERGVVLTQDLLQDLSNAVDRAREKGAKDVVIIGPQSAFVVNVPNNTVITTMNAREMRENIFTNIDSTVIL